MEQTDDNSFKKDKGLSTKEAAMLIVSSIMGSGIISVPYAFTVAGLKFAIFINIFLICSILFCTYFYLKARENYKVESFTELCYMCFGKKSIYIINIMIGFIIYFVIILFLILLSNICVQVFSIS